MTRRLARILFPALIPALLIACGDKGEEATPGTSDDGGADDSGADDSGSDDGGSDGDGGTDTGDDCVPTDEVCDGEDNDCDGEIDEDAIDAETWFVDGDGDGYGDDATTEKACELSEGLSAVGGDCNDDDASSYPEAFELCDGADNDCDGTVDGTSVPGDFATIQAAVDAAVAGELICLDAGTYPESVVIDGKAVRLGGGGPGEVRVHPAAAEGEGVVYSIAVVEANGTALFGMSLGETQVVDSDEVLLRDLVIDQAGCSLSDCKGGALSFTDSGADLVDVRVQDNELSASSTGTFQFEGLVFAQGSTLTWTGGGFVGNDVSLEGQKVFNYGLVYLYQSALTATDLVFEDNDQAASATSASSSQPAIAYQAGLIYAVETDLDLTDVWLLDNSFQSEASNSAGGTANALTYVGVTQESGGSLRWAGGGLVDGFANSVGGSQSVVSLGYTGADSADLTGVDIHDNDLYGLVTDSDSTYGASCWGLYFAGTPASLRQVDVRANQSVCEGTSTSQNLGQLVHTSGSTTYDNVVLAGNYTATSGTVMGQLVLAGEESAPALTNVTVHDNAAYGALAKSGAIVADENGIELRNVVVTDNTVGVSSSDADHTGASALHVEGSTDVTIIYSNFSGNSTGAGTHFYVDGAELEDDIIGSDGNIEAEPDYVDASGTDPEAWDLHLASGSALIDAGDPSVEDEDGSRSDIGAYGGPDGGW